MTVADALLLAGGALCWYLAASLWRARHRHPPIILPLTSRHRRRVRYRVKGYRIVEEEPPYAPDPRD